MMWLSFEYEPKRWMTKESYYNARRLHRIVIRRMFNSAVSSGGIGRFEGVRFIES